MTACFFLGKTKLKNFVEQLSVHYTVYYPVKSRNQRFFKKFSGSLEDIVLGEVRTFEPLKAFYTRARETVAVNFTDSFPHDQDQPFAILGVKACDLKGFKIQDFVFGDSGCADPFYMKNREQNLIVSADCTCAIDTCYCLALGIQPHPQEDFDLNMSEVDGGFVVEIGSQKGKTVVDENPSLFETVRDGHNAKKSEQRGRVIKEVEANLKKYAVPYQDQFKGIIERNYQGPVWEDEAKTCVECGACNTICPTCHCFLLADQKDGQHMIRHRLWDSCMIKDFARVAGGANPRKKLWMRLRNRFEKKFDFFPKVAQVYACTGCGRCISACPAKIDIRRVLKRLVQNV
ncbi:MAG: 4Fe-4S dicluster domain-containing protein [Candidatus Omnitrophica bacterium]|nr:4Fe-4S dicluster domain-containing protein [Candidatus Omnitrophota bacterium]